MISYFFAGVSISTLCFVFISYIIVLKNQIKMLETKLESSEEETRAFKHSVDIIKETFKDNAKELKTENDMLIACISDIKKQCSDEQWERIENTAITTLKTRYNVQTNNIGNTVPRFDIYRNLFMNPCNISK